MVFLVDENNLKTNFYIAILRGTKKVKNLKKKKINSESSRWA